jgi:hypothetical protein
MVNSRPRLNNITFEDQRLLFRNFAGAEGKFNAEGDRNFCMPLDQEVADAMAADLWNIKTLKPREEGDLPTPYIQVEVKFPKDPQMAPPKLVLISSKGQTTLSEAEVEILDWVAIKTADVIIRPYQWAVNGNEGTKAYLKTLFITLDEDDLELKYANVEDSGQSTRFAPDEEPTF